MRQDIAKYAVCKSEVGPPASSPAEGPLSSPLMSSPLLNPLMSSPSSASLDQSTEGLKYPPPGSLSIADKTLYNRMNYRLKNAAMPSVVQWE